MGGSKCDKTISTQLWKRRVQIGGRLSASSWVAPSHSLRVRSSAFSVLSTTQTQTPMVAWAMRHLQPACWRQSCFCTVTQHSALTTSCAKLLLSVNLIHQGLKVQRTLGMTRDPSRWARGIFLGAKRAGQVSVTGARPLLSRQLWTRRLKELQ